MVAMFLREVFYLTFLGVVVGTGTEVTGSDNGISVDVSVALNFGVSAAGGVLCSMSFAGSCCL